MQFARIRLIIQLRRTLVLFLRQKDFPTQTHSINKFYSGVKLLFTRTIANCQIERRLSDMEANQILQKH